VKDLSEVFLSAHDKEWLKRHAREQEWTVADLQKDLLKKTGQDVDPASIREFVDTPRNEWLSRTNESRTRGDRQATARPDAEKQLTRVARRLEQEGNFDPKNEKDTREKELRAIAVRRGRDRFRQTLLEAYRGRCAITNCDCPHALEGAHIRAYQGKETDHVQNGLLLRSDIHTLFDLGKIGINPKTLKVIVARELRGTVYETLSRKRLRPPSDPKMRPNQHVLRQHSKRWGL
jgi:hypothetical protein